MRDRVDVVVVGAGQAGLGAAKVIADDGLDVAVLERGRIGETWLSQRWDSFALNTPNWMNGLPESPYPGTDPDGFASHTDLVGFFVDYTSRFGIEVQTGHEVTRISPADAGAGRFTVDARSPDGDVSLTCSHVVVASGIAREPRIPGVASRLPDRIHQLSTGTYRSPGQVPDGAVLVVGGGQSGGQIVEDLLDAGRTVYYSISNVGRVPRRYRGRDFMAWMLDLGIWDIPRAKASPEMVSATNPLTSGVGPRGHTISFQQLAAAGARLMGRLEDVEDGLIITDDRALDYVRFSDEFSRELKDNIDEYIVETGLEADDPEPDPADDELPDDAVIDFQNRLDLAAAGVSTVIWCTGFSADFSWIDLPALDGQGLPVHDRGVSPVPGLYFIGFPWLATRKSGVVYGIEEDARHIARVIAASG